MNIEITDTLALFVHEMKLVLSLISMIYSLGAPFQSMYSMPSVHVSATFHHVVIDIAWLE